MLAHDIINAGSANIVVSGGLPRHERAPYLHRRPAVAIVSVTTASSTTC